MLLFPATAALLSGDRGAPARSFGLVKVIEAPSSDKQPYVLEPKEAFWALADAHRQPAGR